MSAANAQIGEWLGIQSRLTDWDLLRIVEGRLSISIIKQLVALGLKRYEIDGAIMPSRTSQRKRIRREKLTVDESDRVLRMIRTIAIAETIYGSRSRALAWMRIPQAGLEARTPLSLLNTGIGSRVVEELLVQIDEGIYA
jgi:putative toxin-antitoxin system antitoxin component (TIGR02293 family)